MKEGKSAMGLQWSDGLYKDFCTANGFNLDFGFAPIPGKVSILTGGAYFINKNTKILSEVVDYIIDMMQYKNQVKLAKNGLCSPLLKVYNNPEVKKLPYCDAVKTSIERGIYMMEAGKDIGLISTEMSKYLQKAWFGELTAEQALAKMQEEIERQRLHLYNQTGK
jgi:ABC-type glycerol-3-phosphate transport system substrate-binding protein